MMARVVSRQQQAGTSNSAADGLPAVADHHLRDAERQKLLSTLLDKQAQPRQEKKTLLMQLQRLHQELGLAGPDNLTQAPATVAGTTIASALDSLAAAAAAAAAEPPTHGQQLQQHTQHILAPQLSPTDVAHRDKLSPTTHLESGEQTDTRSHKPTFEQAKTDGADSAAGPVPEEQQATAGPASGKKPNNFTAAAAISPGVPSSKGTATGPRQQQQAGSAGGNNQAAQLPTQSNSSALQPPRKRARVHEAQAQHFQIAKQFQHQYQQQLRLQGQAQGQDHPESHQQDSGVTAPTSSKPKPRTASLQQALQQQVQQLLLPELDRQAIQQSLDPTTQCMVECGSATGIFCVDRERISCLCSICAQNKGPHKPEFAPSEFERHGGMAACKKWRFSIKVADGGPGMTLGRWLDMRGIQISSYPTKFKHPVAKSKRPLESGRGLMDTPPGSQPDLAQLLASLNGSNTRAAGPTQAAAGSSTASAVAAVFQVLADKACSTGAATGSSNDTLKQLAAAVAELLANELPAEAPPAALESSAATLVSNQQQQAATAAAAVDVPVAVVNGASPIGPPAADEPSVSTCMWPETATVDASDLLSGYALAAQAVAVAEAADGGHRAAVQGRHSLQSPLSAGRGSTQSDPEPHQHQLGLVPSRSSVSTPLHLPSLLSWGSAGMQTTQRRPGQQQQQYIASMAPPAGAGRLNAVLPTHASVSGSGTSPDCAAVGHRSSGEASAGFSLPGQPSPGHPLHRSPGPVAPASSQQAGLTGPNHHHQQQHQNRPQLVQLQRRASLGTQNGLAPASAAVSAHAAALRPSHLAEPAAGRYPPPPAAAADLVPSAASSADWCKIVGSLESRLDLLLEDRKRRMQLEEQVAVLTDQVLLMQQQLTDERRLRDVAEQQLASLRTLLMQKLDARLDGGGTQQQHMVAAVDMDADAELPAASAEGAVNGESTLIVGAAGSGLAGDHTPSHEVQQHSKGATAGAQVATNGGAQELGESDAPTVGVTTDRSLGNAGNAHKGDGSLPAIKQENDVDGGAVEWVTAMPAEQRVSAAAAEQSPTASNGVNGTS